MNQNYTLKNHSILNSSQKLIKLKYLLQKSKTLNPKIYSDGNQELGIFYEKSSNVSPDFSLYLSLIEKPINLLFSIDQFLFEFSKKTYQQKKVGEFFQQLKERKKLSIFYGGLSRKYINNVFNKAKITKGSLSKNVLCLLERRLDVVLYRSGFTKTIAEARQFILHKKILINQKPLNFPSYLVEPGDIISVISKTVNNLNLEFSKGLKAKSIKSHSKIFGDFYSKVKKSLNKPVIVNKIVNSDKSQEKGLSITERTKYSGCSTSQSCKSFRSRLLCTLFINLVCTQIKTRSYLDLKKNHQLTNKKKTDVFIIFKKSQALSQRNSVNESSFRKNQYNLNNSQQSYFSITGKSLKKKPVIWNRQITSYKDKKNRLNHKTTQQYQKIHHIWKQKHGKKNLILDKYRYCFLHFLKSLDNYQKFSGLVHLNLKKSAYKKSLYKRRSPLLNSLTFRVIKPIHLEVSYKLLTIIYLYSPQRLNYPFLIDLDVINRSLS